MSPLIDKTEESLQQFWLQRWQDGDIGWHHQEINAHLLAHWLTLGVERDSRVFVPMCGKTRDMAWLELQGHSILGVEISEIAVEQFFAEQGLTPEHTSSEPFQSYQAENFELLCGDLFQLRPDHIRGISAVYDRASLVALDARYRQAYAKLLADLLPANCRVLLVAMDYPQDEMQGPPYSVPEDEVKDLFAGDFRITHLHTLDLLQDTDRYTNTGLSRLSEHIYKLQRK